MQTVRSSPGLEDFWQLHYASTRGAANMPAPMIANLDETRRALHQDLRAARRQLHRHELAHER